MFLVPFLLAFILAGFLSHAPSTEGATSPEADPLKTGRSFVKVEPERIEEYRLKVKEMFYHGFYSYMSVAFPLDEMKPLSGAGFDTLGNFSLTLVDALDTLMVLGDKTSFIYGLRLLGTIDFRLDVNVSVFETNIRILGGLLSCHIMAATDPYVSKFYDWSLLEKAEDLGNRLLVAFDTPTGLPYGTVNLLTGVNKDESEDVCTACAGSFSIEFTWLSLLTDNPKYEMAARRAMRALWKRRSTLDLFGNHINVRTGEWTYKECTIGGLVDSYYEYLLKSYVGFSDEEEYNEMFWRSYRAVKIYMKQNDWHVDVDMNTGTMYAPLFHSLGAFWPGVKIMAGDVSEAMAELNSISYLFNHVKFLPEALNLQNSNLVEGRIGYPLRPEFVESLWLAFRATKDSNILQLGMEIVDRLNNMTRTKYGFANVKDVRTAELEDKMESFFLAETLKYLYLLFDASNPFNSKNYIFNTEAHPFPVY
ncbi:glycoside hydrolase [Chytridium lagenaria]|nr:glycoside hydrolase [Chytridium lagenaria]